MKHRCRSRRGDLGRTNRFLASRRQWWRMNRRELRQKLRMVLPRIDMDLLP